MLSGTETSDFDAVHRWRILVGGGFAAGIVILMAGYW